MSIALLGRLVRRSSLQGRPGDAGRRGDRPRLRGDDRNPARRGAQRHHGPRLPDRLRGLPDQRPPAPGATARARFRTRPRRDAPLLDKGPLVIAGHRRRARRLGQAHLPDPGRGDRRRRRPLQRQGQAPDHSLGDGPLDARGRRLLVRAGGDQDRRQPDPADRVRAAATCRRPDQMPLDPRPRFAVAHYLTEPTIYRTLVLPPARKRLRPALAADPDRRVSPPRSTSPCARAT